MKKLTSSKIGQAKAFDAFRVFTKESDYFQDFNLKAKSAIEHVSFPIDKIKKKLENLNPYKPPEADELHPGTLKEWSNELFLPLSLVFLKLFSEGELPQNWKESIIAPTCIKGKKEFASNCRPISLLFIWSWNR